MGMPEILAWAAFWFLLWSSVVVAWTKVKDL